MRFSQERNKMKYRQIIAVFLMVWLTMSLPVHAEASSKAYFTCPGVQDGLETGYAYEGAQYAQAYAWKNETVFFKTAFQAGSACDVNVTITPLYHPKSDETIPFSIGRLAPSQSSLGMGIDSSAPKVTTFDRISEETSAHLEAGETAYFWIMAEVGEVSPGKYEGMIHIQADQDHTLGISVVVSPFSLSQEQVSLDLWQYPYSSFYRYDALKEEEPFSDRHLEVLRKEMELYHRAGGDTVTCTITEEPWAHQTCYDTPSLVKWNRDGSGNLWFDYSAFDRWVELCSECGINGDIECFSPLPYDNALVIYSDMNEPVRTVLEPGTYDWEFCWQNFFYSFSSHLNEKGWLDRVRLAVDERGIQSVPLVQELLSTIPDGERFRFSAAVNAVPEDYAFYDRFASVSFSVPAVPHQSEAFQEFLAHRKEAGLETTLYNCSTNYPNTFAVSDPYETVWTMEYLGMYGFDGFLRWAYNAWPEGVNALTDNPHFESGDTFLIYPDEKDSSMMLAMKSVRLCMIEQGLADVKKYRILLRTMNPETAEILRQGFARMERWYGSFNAWGAMSPKSDDDRTALVREVLRLESLLQKASAEAAMEARGESSSTLKEQMENRS